MLDGRRSEVKWKSTGYPLHSPLTPSLPHPCITLCNKVSKELYKQVTLKVRFNDSIVGLTKLDKTQRNTGLLCDVFKSDEFWVLNSFSANKNAYYAR